MTDAALRSDGGSPFRFPRRTRVSERGGLDRFAHRLAGGPDRARTDVPPRPVPWPSPPSVGTAASRMVAPSSTTPAVVVHPRITTAGPLEIAVETAPPITLGDRPRPTPPAPPRRVGFGVVAAMLTHLLGLAVLLAAPAIESSGGGVEAEIQEISLVFTEASLDTIAGAPAAATAADEPPPADPLPLVEPVAAEAPTAPPPEAPVPIETAAAEIAPPPLETPALLATPLPAETTAPPPPAETVAPQPPVEPPPPAPRPISTPTSAPPRPASRPTVRPDSRPAPAPRKAERKSAEKPRAAAAAAAPGNAARDAVSGARSAGEAPGAGAGAQADWRAAVLAALARAKRYPDDARDRGLSGRAVVSFTVSRDGSVGAIALAASSGVPALDAATLAMPRRAAFPPMPPGGPDIRTFTAGVRYDLH